MPPTLPTVLCLTNTGVKHDSDRVGHRQRVAKQLAITNAHTVVSNIATDMFLYIPKLFVFSKQLDMLPPKEEHVYVRTIGSIDIVWAVAFEWRNQETLHVQIDDKCVEMAIKLGQYARNVDLVHPLGDQKLKYYETTVEQHVYNKILNVLCNKQLLQPK